VTVTRTGESPILEQPPPEEHRPRVPTWLKLVAVLVVVGVVAAANLAAAERSRRKDRAAAARVAAAVPSQPDHAAQPEVDDVRLEPYAVAFRLTIGNSSDQPFRVVNLVGRGLALSAVGGLPTAVEPEDGVALQVRLSIPACAPLPPAVEVDSAALRFGAFRLDLTDLAGRPYALPFLTDPDTPLYTAIRTLARKICPRQGY
jgi:hypothetical protein